MEIAFRVRDVEVPDGVRHRTRDRVARLAARFDTDRAVVWFSEERNPRISERQLCQITLFGRGRTLRAHAAATDVTIAAERVVAKLAQRAERLRGREAARSHRHWCSGAGSSFALSGGWYPGGLPAAGPGEGHWWCSGGEPGTGPGEGWVHSSPNRSSARREPGAVDLVAGGAGEFVLGSSEAENVIPQADALTPEEAALEMAARGHDVYFFVNTETGRPAVVFARKDGNIAFYHSATARLRPGVVT